MVDKKVAIVMGFELETFDTDDATKPDLNHEEVRKRRKTAANGDSDPWETLGGLLAEMVQVQTKLREWNGTATSLNTRLARIEKLLYGAGGSAALMLLEYLARRLGLHLP